MVYYDSIRRRVSFGYQSLYLFGKWIRKKPQKRTEPENVVIDKLESLQNIPLYFSEVTLGELHYGIARSKRKEQRKIGIF